jgi:tetratricopeptide (TPR) repeat protein
MKRVLFTLMAVLAITALAMGQTQAAPATGGQQQQATGAQAAPAAPSTKPLPQAKTQEEFNAYKDALAKATPAEKEAAAADFAQKFPTSELKSLVFYQTMLDYQAANDADKTVEMGRKVLSYDSNNPLALVAVATVLAERTRSTDLNKDERVAEASKDAQLALKTIDTDLMAPPGLPPERIEEAKNAVRSMAYAAIGNAATVNEDYKTAEENLKKSVELQPESTTYLRLAIVLDREKKYSDAMLAANKAFDSAPAGSPAQNLAKQERERLMKLNGTPAAPAATPAAPAAAPAQTPPPAKQ